MSDPYAAVRLALAKYAAMGDGLTIRADGSVGPASPTDGGGAYYGNLLAVGRYNSLTTKLVATFPSVAYNRALESLHLESDQYVRVHLYYGSETPAGKLSSFGNGFNSDYAPPIARLVPAGAPLLIVWDVFTTTATGFGVAQLKQIP